jgi:hypothetical protein
MPLVDLSLESALQNIPSGTSVTFRLYAWGATGGPGTFAIGRLAGDDLAFVGTIGLGDIVSFETQGLAGDDLVSSAITQDTDLQPVTLERGPGLNGSALTNGFSSNAFTISGTKNDAIINDEYLEVAIDANDFSRTSFSELNATVRRSATGPNTYQWQYSLDGFTTPGIDIGAEGSYLGTENNGLAMPAVDLSIEPSLQSVKNVTFRLYAWGATTGAGTFAIGRLSGNDLIFSGEVNPNSIIAFEHAGRNGDEPTSLATTIDSHLVPSILSRGAGIAPSVIANTYGFTGFNAGGTSTDAILDNEYVEFAAETVTGYHARFNRLEFTLRRSATGPTAYQWFYSRDGFVTSGTAIGVPSTYTGTEANGLAMAAIDLSAISDIQNTTGATFRLYAWGASDSSGTLAIGRLPGNDLSLIGEVDINQYIAQYLAGTGGAISGSSTQLINHGGATSPVTATPLLGFRFIAWSDTSTSTSRSDSPVIGNATFTASFSPIITSIGGPGGFTPPPGIGLGTRDETVAMRTHRDIGEIGPGGVNALLFIDSTANFRIDVPESEQTRTSSITLTYADLYKNTIRLRIGDTEQEVALAINDTTLVDTDGDGKSDLIATFVHVYINRIEVTLMSITTTLASPEQPLNKPAATKEPLFNFSRNLKTLDTGEDVRQLQIFLNAQGFVLATTGPGSPGQETSKFGALTRNALIRYQTSRSIQPAIGYFGPITRGVVNNQ